MVEKLVNEISITSFQDEMIDLLNLELQINEKKLNNEELTSAEYLFDNYCIKPSFLLRHLINKGGKNEKS